MFEDEDNDEVVVFKGPRSSIHPLVDDVEAVVSSNDEAEQSVRQIELGRVRSDLVRGKTFVGGVNRPPRRRLRLSVSLSGWVELCGRFEVAWFVGSVGNGGDISSWCRLSGDMFVSK